MPIIDSISRIIPPYKNTGYNRIDNITAQNKEIDYFLLRIS